MGSLSTSTQQEQRVRKIQEEALEGNLDESDWEYNHLFEEGQSDRKPLILDSRDSGDHVITVIENSMKDHSTAGTVGTFKAIVKGECKHCGSNRLEIGVSEPAGISYTACPICNRDNMSNGREFKYETKVK